MEIFDTKPHLCPELPPSQSRRENFAIRLSKQQEGQIEDIFKLFDIDGGGTIDRHELNFALVALGFGDKAGSALVDNIIADGEVTLEEFKSLMKGELSGKDPWEELRSVFAVLSRDDGDTANRNFITLDKLKAVSREFQVKLSQDEIEAMVREVDDDGSGTVDFEEFEHILRTSAWF